MSLSATCDKARDSARRWLRTGLLGARVAVDWRIRRLESKQARITRVEGQAVEAATRPEAGA